MIQKKMVRTNLVKPVIHMNQAMKKQILGCTGTDSGVNGPKTILAKQILKKARHNQNILAINQNLLKVKMTLFPSISIRGQGRGAAIQKPETPPRCPEWISNLSMKVVDIQKHEPLTKQLLSFVVNKDAGELSEILTKFRGLSDDKPNSTRRDSNQTITADDNEYKADNLDKAAIQPHTEPDMNMSDDEF